MKYNESAFNTEEPGGHISLLQYTESYDENQHSPHEGDMNRGGAPLQQKARHQSNIRVRDMKKKKSKAGLAGGAH